MGTISKGILGGFSGKVGTIVGGTWKGITYMRSIPNKKKNFRPTDKQLAQQLKFTMAMRFASSMTPLLAETFKSFAIEKTGMNSFVSHVLQAAVVGVFPNFDISYPNVLVSRGDLPNVLAPTATIGAARMLTFSWTDNTGVGIAKATDKAVLLAYCPELNQAIYTTGSADRSALTDQLDLAGFSGKIVETYIGFMSEDGFHVATSIYTGQLTVS